jgi:hypothetical protein
MTTGTIIIKRALQKIGASSAVSEPSPETVQTVFESLNSMISMWSSQSINIGAALLEVPGDDLNENQDCTNAVILNLAVLVSPDFDNGKSVVSPQLQRLATTELYRVKALYQTFVIPKKVYSSTMPWGAGNRINRYKNYGPITKGGN